MKKMIETPPKTTLNPTETTIIVDSKNPIPRNSVTEVCKPATPNRLKVPKAFKYPERWYTSPTDLMMSPVSRGLLARSRKSSRLLPPSNNQPNLQSLKPQEVGLNWDLKI